MDEEEFIQAVTFYFDGPEHDAYYDALDFIKLCAKRMTVEQRELIVLEWSMQHAKSA